MADGNKPETVTALEKIYMLVRSISLSALIITLFAGLSIAEVTLDGTLGTSGNVQGPNYSIEAAIGKQMGSSLFHSFEKFDISTGESATFKGPADVERIISRVTVGNSSKIDGAIRSEIQGADFYFINPFGMIFGPNVTLDITGSFFTTSADYLKLGENGRFDARNPENTVLTSDAPEAFGFLGQRPGSIVVEARKESEIIPYTGIMEYSGLEVNGENRIMIAGGDINIDGGWVKTAKGSLDLVSLGSQGELSIGNPCSDSFPVLGKIEIDNNGSARTEDGGNLSCMADEIRVLSGSGLLSMARYEADKAGDVSLDARKYVLVSGYYPVSSGYTDTMMSAIGSSSDTLFCADAGNLGIRTENLNLEDGGIITTSAYISGSSGDIEVHTKNLMILNGGNIDASIYGGTGKAGNIDINASESVTVSGSDSFGHSQISSKARYSENVVGGNISVTTSELTVEKNGMLNSSSTLAGNAGNICLDVTRLNLLEGGWITASVFGSSGKTGDINIEASESVTISGSSPEGPSQISSKAVSSELSSGIGSISVFAPEVVIEKDGMISSSSIQSGNSGCIILDVARLDLLEGGWITASVSESSGKAGDIKIDASESVIISGSSSNGLSQISSQAIYSENADGGSIAVTAPEFTVEKGGMLRASSIQAGNAGNITLDVAKLCLMDGGWINTIISNGFGKAGDIDIKASDLITVSGNRSMITATAISSSSCGAGNISLDAPDIIISETGNINSISQDSGPAGSIAVSCGGMSLSGHSYIMMSSNASDGGSINIDCNDYFHMNLSGISTSVFGGEGNGGNIVIERPDISTLYRSKIVADAHGGNGGNIDISSGFFIRDVYSIISASSALGIAGRIDIESPETDLDSGLTRFAEEYQDIAGFMINPCIERMEGKSSSLTIGTEIVRRRTPFEYFESSN